MALSYIVLLLFGILIGNFTTTIFYRLPRNITISGFDQKLTKPPFCSSCGHLLRFYEYLPILSWFSTFGKCNYCHIPITKSYIALEILIGVTALILYNLFGSDLELFFLYFCFTTLVILNIFIYSKHNFVPIEISLSVIVLGMIYRTLVDQEILLWLTSISCASIASLWIIRNYPDTLSSASGKNTIRTNTLIHLILPASLWCPNYKILVFAISIALSFLFCRLTTNKLFYPITMVALSIISLY